MMDTKLYDEWWNDNTDEAGELLDSLPEPVATLAAHVNALRARIDGLPDAYQCSCAYDHPDDTCALHRAAQQRTTMPKEASTSNPESRGQVAYMAYGRAVDWKANDGNTMPNWTNLPDDRKAGWVSAADAVWQLATDGRITL